MKVAARWILISALAVPVALAKGYDFMIEREFDNKCRNTPKILVHDAEAFRELSSFVDREKPTIGNEQWGPSLAKIGFRIDHMDSAFGWSLGNTEIKIPILKNGTVVAEVYSVVLNRPNWGGLIGIYGPSADSKCAYNFNEYYPEIWQNLNGYY